MESLLPGLTLQQTTVHKSCFWETLSAACQTITVPKAALAQVRSFGAVFEENLALCAPSEVGVPQPVRPKLAIVMEHCRLGTLFALLREARKVRHLSYPFCKHITWWRRTLFLVCTNAGARSLATSQ